VPLRIGQAGVQEIGEQRGARSHGAGDEKYRLMRSIIICDHVFSLFP
jgi:hypothetical protein